VNGPWWRERSALPALGGVSIPVMYTTDLYDIVQPFDALQLTPGARLNLGMGHLSAGAVAAAGDRHRALVRGPVDRFVARYGLGDDNGAERDPPVTLATNTGSVDDFHDGHLLVRGEDAWPLPSTRWTHLRLGAGTLGERAPADGADTAPLLGGAHADLRTQGFVRGRDVESDMRDAERRGLTYTTPVLRDDLEVSGPIALRLFASATAPDLDWSVRLTDVWPDGRSEWISDGYLRASLRAVDARRSLRDREGRVVRPWLTYDRPAAVPLGRPVEYLIDVIATSNVFRRGHRLRLDVLPVAAAQADSARTGGAGAVTVLRDRDHPSSLTLPVVPGRCGRSAPLAAGTPPVGPCARSYAEAVGR
jgi:putative CocE/NonD family hydrolase